MIITIIFSIFTVYNSPFFRPSDRRRTVGGGFRRRPRSRPPDGRMDGLRGPVCKKTVFSWWGKPVAAAVAVRLGFQVQCLPWSSAVVAVCSRKFASRRSPQTIIITVVVITITVIPRKWHPRIAHRTGPTRYNLNCRVRVRQNTIGSSAYRREFRTLASAPLSHPQLRVFHILLLYVRIK